MGNEPSDLCVSLHRAAQKGNKAEVKRMLEMEGSDVNNNDNYGKTTPLHEAAQHGHQEVVLLLLKHGAKVDMEDNISRTPLHFAVRWDRFIVAKILLDHGACVEKTSLGGKTALHIAAGTGIPRMVKLLLDSDANMFARNDKLQTPFELAVRKGTYNALVCCKLILEATKLEDESCAIGKFDWDEADLAMRSVIEYWRACKVCNVELKNVSENAFDSGNVDTILEEIRGDGVHFESVQIRARGTVDVNELSSEFLEENSSDREMKAKMCVSSPQTTHCCSGNSVKCASTMKACTELKPDAQSDTRDQDQTLKTSAPNQQDDATKNLQNNQVSE